MPVIAVHEVTTFYNMYNQRPVGKFKLNVCTNLPCQLRDGQKALHHLEQKLGVTMGETTADGLFTLQQSECLGACADSPVMLVNDRTHVQFHEQRQARPADRRPARLGGQGMNAAQVLSQFAGHGRADLLPRPPHQSRRSMQGPEWHQLEPQGLRSARRLPGAAQDPGHGRFRAEP